MRQRLLAAFCILLIAATFGGCLEVTETYTINPDGSGKLMLKSTMKSFDFDAEKTAKEKKEELREFVADVIAQSEGVDVWKDVSVKHLADGRIYFEGTAYFPDLSDLNIHQASMSEFRVRKAGGGEMIIEIGEDKEEGEERDTTTGPLTLSEEELAAKIDSVKEEFKTARGMMAMILDEWNARTTVYTAGQIGVANGFTKNPDGSITMEFRGKRVLEIIDSLTAGEQYWRDEALNNNAGKDRDREMRAIMFGAETPMITVSGADKPLFNYATEVAAAKKKYAALRKKYGVEAD